jgi:hypothetical protein
LEVSNLLNPISDPLLWLGAVIYPNPSDSLVLIGHASPSIFGNKNVSQLVTHIKESTNWKPGQAIFLNGCNAGKGNNSIAQQLSKALNGNTVIAPDEDVINILGIIDVGPYASDSNGNVDFNSPGNLRCFGSCLK